MKPGWTTAALGDVAAIERRGVDPLSLKSDTVYLGLEHIEAGGRLIGRSTVRASAVASTKFRFGPEHLLFGKLRPYLGKITAPDFAGVCSTDILPIRPGPRLDRQYLLHFLRQPSVVAHAASRATGANLPRLSPSELGGFELPLPPIEEQRRIAAILDQADSLQIKSQIRAGSLRQAWLRAVEEAARAAGSRVPLGQLIGHGPSNGLYKPQSAYGSGTRIVRIDSFTSGGIDEASLRRLEVDDVERVRFGLAPGDIVINRVNAMAHVGKSALIGKLDEPTVYESNMMRVRLIDDCMPEYVAAWLSTDDARRQIRAKAKQAINQASVNGKDIKSLQIPLLTVTQQAALAEHLSQLDQLALGAAGSAARIAELFQALQARAFSGRL